MATGLLGINPYSSGVNLDLSSKATQVAIQQEQRRQAKAEATEKYLMDYEKSLNPAGMRHVDAKLYNQNMKGAQDYFIQNREKILNPQKFGYEAQSTHLANLRDAATLIDESKTQAARERELNRELFRVRSSGDEIDDASMDGIHHATNYSVRDKAFLPMNAYDLSVIKKYNQKAHQDTLYGNLKMPEVTSIEDAPPEMKGYKKEVTRGVLPTFEEDKKLGTNIIPQIISRGDADYYSSESNRRHVNSILANEDTRNQSIAAYEKVFGSKPKTTDELRQGLYFTMSPNSYKEKFFQPKISEEEKRANQMEDWKEKNNISNAQQNERSAKFTNAITANNSVEFVRSQIKNWDKPYHYVNDESGNRLQVLEPPKAIKDKFANDEKDIDILNKGKVITYKTQPLIVRDNLGEIYAIPEIVNRDEHKGIGKYDMAKRVKITGEFNAKSTDLLVPSTSKGLINQGLSNIPALTPVKKMN